MNYLAVKSYREHQHYKGRNPVWIKLYNRVMDDEAFLALSDAARGHLMLIWLLASRRHNKLPNDAKHIARAIQASGRVNLAELIDAGFLVPWDESLSDFANPASTESPELLDESGVRAMPEKEREEEKEAERETEHSIAVRGGTAEAETALRAAMGDLMPSVDGFLDGRPANARANWFPELLKIIGPATGVLPEDLAGACSDAALVDPPATTPVAIRAFARQRMRERVRASIPVPEIVRAANATPDAVAEDEARWSAALDVASKLRRGAMKSDAFNALPAPLRHALRSVGGWKVLDEAKPSSIPYLRRDFLASYRAAEANASQAGAA